MQETKDLLDALNEKLLALVNAVTAALARWATCPGPGDRAIKDYPELLNGLVRRDQCRTLVGPLSAGGRSLVCCSLGREVEEMIRNADNGRLLAPEQRIAVREAIRSTLSEVEIPRDYDVRPYPV
ncbi:MAG: FHIPEP family type III secretion protein [bacterium]|nr:FHIPEP family type III secretion protein [bacterium]